MFVDREQELAALEREAATRRGLEAYARQDWRSAAAALATYEVTRHRVAALPPN